MLNETLKDHVVRRLLPRVQTPGQYLGGELHAVRKDHGAVRGKLCLAFPDTYAIGMSNHGMQVLYAAMNRREDWACERVYAPPGRTWRCCCARRSSRSTAWRRSRRWISLMCWVSRCSTICATAMC